MTSSADQQELLAEAGRAFGAAFDPVAAPWNVVRFLVPRVADWAMIGVVDDNGMLQRVAYADNNPADDASPASPELFTSEPIAHASAIGHVLRTGRPLVVADLDGRAAVLPQGLANLGLRAFLVLPLGPRRRTFGVLVLGAHEPARFGPSEVRIAVALALRAGIVLDISRRCQDMREPGVEAVESPVMRRRRRELSARARRRAQLARQLIGYD
jgi:GAF domain-containing protein